jgi:hypothetical protein
MPPQLDLIQAPQGNPIRTVRLPTPQRTNKPRVPHVSRLRDVGAKHSTTTPYPTTAILSAVERSLPAGKSK